MSTTFDPTVGETIFKQINAADFWARARWGAKRATVGRDSLTSTCTKGILIQIVLDPSDTYTIQIGRTSWRKPPLKTSDVYADALVRTIDALMSKHFP